MKKDLEDIISLGLCTYQVGIDRDSNGYGYLTERYPTKPCQQICDYCKGQAAHIARLIEEARKWEQTTKLKRSLNA